jgi:hypothetical protein
LLTARPWPRAHPPARSPDDVECTYDETTGLAHIIVKRAYMKKQTLAQRVLSKLKW